jgi:hypothetical protein
MIIAGRLIMNKYLFSPRLIAFNLILIGLLGCNLSAPAQVPTAAAVATRTSPTSQATATLWAPSPSPTNTPIPTPAPSATPAYVTNMQAVVNVDSINLREGPGTTFPIKYKLSNGTQVTISNKAPGNEWVLVQDSQSHTGWLSVSFIDLQGSIDQIPPTAIDFAFVIKGKVSKPDGTPIDGIDIAIRQSNDQFRTDATTKQNGDFFGDLPFSSKGEWSVGMVGINCTSKIMDADCKYSGHFDPQNVTITLPAVNNLIQITYLP